MAQHVVTQYIDDLDGGAASGEIGFALDGRSYSIDLSDENASKLREALAPYVAAARRASSGTTRSSSATRSGSSGSNAEQRAYNQRVRTWLRENGHTVPDRGRISTELLEAYEAGQPGEEPEVTPETPAAEVVANDEQTEKPKRRSRAKKAEAENVVEFQAADEQAS